MEQENTVDFYILPEGCISNILSLTSPRDACRSSLVSSTFKSASDSHYVWEKFLPSDYQEIISRSVSTSPPIPFSSKKDLYFRLCDNPILIDGGNKSFAVDKWSGKKCYMLGARELLIIWGDNPEYWAWRSLPESRFSEVAELLNVCWLEIHGKMETRILSPKTTYTVYLVIKFVEGAQGLEYMPANASVKFVGGSGGGGERVVYLDPQGGRRHVGLIRHRFSHLLRAPPSMSRWEGNFPRERVDGWMEIEIGEFFNDKGEDGEVQMSLKEVTGGHWKSGLIIQGIELRPKESK